MMYIPPRGAMQFERRKVSDLNSVPLDEVPFYWVHPREPMRRNTLYKCGCTTVFPIVIDSLPEPFKTRAVDALAKQKMRASVCDCKGVIIE